MRNIIHDCNKIFDLYPEFVTCRLAKILAVCVGIAESGRHQPEDLVEMLNMASAELDNIETAITDHVADLCGSDYAREHMIYLFGDRLNA